MKVLLFSSTLLAAGAGLAATARAQFDPRTLVDLGHADPEHIPLPYFDVRLDDRGLPQPFVDAAKRAAFTAAERRARRAELDRLALAVPMLRTQEHELFATPQWIGSTVRFLTPAAELAPRDVVATFVARHPALFEIGPAELAEARVTREIVTRHNGVTHLTWQQELDGLAVVGAVLRANVTRDGELINVSSSFVPAPEGGFELPEAQLPALDALRAAGRDIGAEITTEPEVASAGAGAAEPTVWGTPDFRSDVPVTTERVVFAWTRERLVPAFRVLLPKLGVADTYEVVVDATNGTILQRIDHTKYLGGTEDITFTVYTGDSPAPGTPGPATPNGSQFPFVPRAAVTVTGASVAAWSPNGWINDGVNATIGNNVAAHTDLNADNSPDLPRPAGAPYRVFDFAQDNALPPSSWRSAAVVQFFYLANRFHDKLFALGFDEAAKNFQLTNFSGQGAGNDRIQADVQDGSGTNNANFFTIGADGTDARCQMYVFTGPTPDRDGDLDADIVFHELTHGVSTRLLDGSLNGRQSEGMAEGWSDFFGACLNAEPGDDPHGVYTIGGYSTPNFNGPFVDNYYFGIRRFPYSTDLNKNPQTYADIDPAQQSYPPSVPRSPVIPNDANEEHNVGEVWCMALWEARANIVAAHGFAGNDLMLQLVVDGMKLSVNSPTFLDGRDAILQADMVNNGGANRAHLWQAFAKRGMGSTAASPAGNSSSGIVESFTLPELVFIAYPGGRPAQLLPGQPASFPVDVIALGTPVPVPGSGRLLVSIDGGAFVSTPMSENGPDAYIATLLATYCFDTVDWYVAVDTSTGTVFEPEGAPAVHHRADVFTTHAVVSADAFESNQGWVAGAVGDTASTGLWVRGDPVGTTTPGGTAVQPEDDHTSPPGTQCWVTGQGNPGGSTSSADVDGGRTTLTTPVFDLSTLPTARCSYWCWYSNNTSSAPGADVFRIDVSNDGGLSWFNAETIGPATGNGGGWTFHEFRIADFVTPTAAVRVRFVAEDAGIGSVVEAAIDDFEISATDCTGVPVGGFCAGDGSLPTACPCSNFGAPGHGCANSVNASGSALVASGTTNPDTIVLTANGLPTSQAVIFLQSDGYAPDGMAFGDGLRCLDGFLVRVGSRSITAGASQFPGAGDPPLSVRGHVLPGSGAFRAYQLYYRNSAAAFCPPETFNVSSGWTLLW